MGGQPRKRHGKIFIDGSALQDPFFFPLKFQQPWWPPHFTDSLSFTGSFQLHMCTYYLFRTAMVQNAITRNCREQLLFAES